MKYTLGMVATAAVLAFGVGTSKPALACAGDSGQTIGSICMVSYNYCPRNFVQAKGQLINISDNTALFSLLGTTFGGNGTTTFAVPDLRSRLPIGVGNGPGLLPVVWGMQRGFEQVTLNAANLPSHIHLASATFAGSGGGGSSAAIAASTSAPERSAPQDGDYLAAGSQTANTLSNNYRPYRSSAGTTVSLGGVSGQGGGGGGGGTVAVTVGSTGASQPVEVFDPTTGVYFCIATAGLYPSRN